MGVRRREGRGGEDHHVLLRGRAGAFVYDALELTASSKVVVQCNARFLLAFRVK